MDLTTTAAVKSVLHITEDTDDAMIDTFVTQASQDFSTEARRQFYATAGATLTYDIAPPQIIGNKLYFATDVQAVDRIVNGDGSVIDPTAYRLLPLNATPKYAAQLFNGGNVAWLSNPTTLWQNAIQVQGTIGYNPTNAIPSDVVYAVTKLAAFYYQTRDNSGDVVKFADGTTVIPANAPAVVLKTAKNYARVQIFT